MRNRISRSFQQKVWNSTWEKSVIALCNCMIAHPTPTRSLEALSFNLQSAVRPFWWKSSHDLFSQISRYIFRYTNLYSLLSNRACLAYFLRHSNHFFNVLACDIFSTLFLELVVRNLKILSFILFKELMNSYRKRINLI